LKKNREKISVKNGMFSEEHKYEKKLIKHPYLNKLTVKEGIIYHK